MFAAALLIGGLTVTLPDAASVKGSEVELVEVAQLNGDPALVALAEDISLGWAPAPGYERTLHAAQVARRVRTALAGVDVTITGAARCKLAPEVQIVPAARIEAAARELLEQLADEHACAADQWQIAEHVVSSLVGALIPLSLAVGSGIACRRWAAASSVKSVDAGASSMTGAAAWRL